MSTTRSKTPDPDPDPWDQFPEFSAALKHVLQNLVGVTIDDPNTPPIIISSIREEGMTQANHLIDLDRNFVDEPLATTRLIKAKNGKVPPFHRNAITRVQRYAHAFATIR